MMPSPTELEYFYEVAKTLNFSKAAINLHITQPSLSMAIKRLENRMKLNLFIRHKQGVMLTQSGQALMKEVHGLLEKWANIKANMDTIKQTAKGRVRIGCNSALNDAISSVSTYLMQKHDALEIHIEHALTNKIMPDISQGHLDIGIVINPNVYPDVILKTLREIEFACWHRKGIKKDFSWKNVIVICDPRLMQTQYLLNQLGKNTHLRLSTANQLETIAAMTIEGNGIGLLPTCLVQSRYNDQLEQIKDTPKVMSTMYLAYNIQNKNNPAIQTVLQVMKTFSENFERIIF